MLILKEEKNNFFRKIKMISRKSEKYFKPNDLKIFMCIDFGCVFFPQKFPQKIRFF